MGQQLGRLSTFGERENKTEITRITNCLKTSCSLGGGDKYSKVECKQINKEQFSGRTAVDVEWMALDGKISAEIEDKDIIVPARAQPPCPRPRSQSIPLQRPMNPKNIPRNFHIKMAQKIIPFTEGDRVTFVNDHARKIANERHNENQQNWYDDLKKYHPVLDKSSDTWYAKVVFVVTEVKEDSLHVKREDNFELAEDCGVLAGEQDADAPPEAYPGPNVNANGIRLVLLKWAAKNKDGQDQRSRNDLLIDCTLTFNVALHSRWSFHHTQALHDFYGNQLYMFIQPKPSTDISVFVHNHVLSIEFLLL